MKGYHTDDPIEPYSATFWFSLASSVCGLCLVPWVTLGTQGQHRKEENVEPDPGRDQLGNIESSIEDRGIEQAFEKDIKPIES